MRVLDESRHTVEDLPTPARAEINYKKLWKKWFQVPEIYEKPLNLVKLYNILMYACKSNGNFSTH